MPDETRDGGDAARSGPGLGHASSVCGGRCGLFWTCVQKKQAQLTEGERENPELGDQYVFVAIDAETKLVPTFLVGKRSGQTALQFMIMLQKQLAENGRVQLTTAGF